MGKVWIALAVVVALALAAGFTLNYLGIDGLPAPDNIPAEYE